MNQSKLLEQWSQDRSALAAALAPRAASVVPARPRGSSGRSVSGMHWRGPWVVTAAEALAGSDEARVIWDSGEVRAPVVACDLATDVALLRLAADPAIVNPGIVGDALLTAGASVIIRG